MRKKIVFIFAFLLLTAVMFSDAEVVRAHGYNKYKVTLQVHASQDPGMPVVQHSKARLFTNEDGIFATVRTRDLTPGHAVTLWFIVINNPSACASLPCTAPEILGNTAALEAQVTYGGGGVVNHSGRIWIAGQLPAGEVPNGWYPGQEFTHPTSAEVHLILNDHGPVLEDYMPEMIQTYRAGCTDESLPPPFPDTAKADGTPGPNTCRLVQFAIISQQ